MFLKIMLVFIAIFIIISEARALNGTILQIKNVLKRTEQRILSILLIIFLTYFIFQPNLGQKIENYMLLIGLSLSVYYFVSVFKKKDVSDFEEKKKLYNESLGPDSSPIEMSKETALIGCMIVNAFYSVVIIACTCLVAWN